MPLSLNVVFNPNPFLVTQVLLPSSEFCFFCWFLFLKRVKSTPVTRSFLNREEVDRCQGFRFFLSFRGSLFLKAVPTCASDSDPDPDPDLSPDPDSCYCADFVGFERVVLT